MKKFQDFEKEGINVKLIDFLYNHTPAGSMWVVKDHGWRAAMFYIDHEDLWAGWYPSQHRESVVKSYTYDEATMKGTVEI